MVQYIRCQCVWYRIGFVVQKRSTVKSDPLMPAPKYPPSWSEISALLCVLRLLENVYEWQCSENVLVVSWEVVLKDPGFCPVGCPGRCSLCSSLLEGGRRKPAWNDAPGGCLWDDRMQSCCLQASLGRLLLVVSYTKVSWTVKMLQSPQNFFWKLS